MAKLNDKETLSIANAVSDVLEGKQEAYHGNKKKEQYDSDKDHSMDPTSHVKKDEKTGMYCVYNVKGRKVAEFKTKAEADAYSKKNHDALMKEGPEEPRAKGEKEFKDKHVIKKSGENPDGTVTKEAKVVLTDEEKYKEFFARALEKFGVKSPAELDKEKRKEFFNYVDKNYKGVDEVLGVVKKAAKSVGRKIDKVAGTDLSGDKKAEIKQKLKDIDAKMDKHGTAIDNSKADLKAGKIDRSKQSSIENFHQSAMRNLEIEQEKLEAQLSGKKESVDEFLGHRIPSAGADSSGIRKATGANNKAPNTGSPRQSDDNKVKQIQNRIAQKEAEAEKHDKAGREFYSRAEDAKDKGDDDKYEDLMARSDEADSQYQSAKNEVEELQDKLKKAKAEFNKKHKKESVDEGLIDTIKTQLANLKKKKDSGNSSMDDATITKIASLLQKKARAVQEMEKLEQMADKLNADAEAAMDRGDHDKEQDLQYRADSTDEKARRKADEVEEIDDQIQKLKKGASKSKDVKEYGNVMSKKMKMRKDKEVHASYGKK